MRNPLEARLTTRSFLRVLPILPTALALACQQQESTEDAAATNTAIVKELAAAQPPPTESPIPPSTQIPSTATPDALGTVTFKLNKLEAEVAASKITPSETPIPPSPTANIPATVESLQKQAESSQAKVEALQTQLARRDATPTETVPKDWVRLQSPGLGPRGYQLGHPRWAFDKYEAIGGTMVERLSGETIKGTPTYIAVFAQSLDSPMSSEDYARKIFEELKSYYLIHAKDSEKGLKMSRFRVIDGEDAWSIALIGRKGPDAPYDYNSLSIRFVKQNYGWGIALVTHPDAFDSTLPVFHKILDSFKVL